MGCTKCGTDSKLVKLLIESAIQQMLDEGKLQAGLHDCAETDKDSRGLPRGSKVVLCDKLGDQICQLVEDGEVCFVKPVTLNYDSETGKLVLGMTDGETLQTTIKLPKLDDKLLKSATFDSATGIVSLTMNDDATVHKVDLSELKVKVNAEKQDDGTVVITNQDGSTVSIDPVRKGDKGEKGEDGRHGVDGKSAYQLWLDQGNTGTVEDFIASLKGATGAKGAKGDTGAQGPKGEPFEVYKTFASVTDMEASTDVPEGKFVVITSDVDDEDNAKLYVKGENGFTYITDLSGAKGIKGDVGPQGPKGDTGAKGGGR